MACLVAANILFIGIRLIHESSSRLMDASDPELLDQITGVINRHRKDIWIDIHHLRAWRSGDRIHVDFHVILPRDLSLEKAHNEVTLIEHILKEDVPGLGDALIHAEPCIAPECPMCGRDPCDNRGKPATHLSLWNHETVATLGRSESAGPRRSGMRKSRFVRRFSRAVD